MVDLNHSSQPNPILSNIHRSPRTIFIPVSNLGNSLFHRWFLRKKSLNQPQRFFLRNFHRSNNQLCYCRYFLLPFPNFWTSPQDNYPYLPSHFLNPDFNLASLHHRFSRNKKKIRCYFNR